MIRKGLFYCFEKKLSDKKNYKSDFINKKLIETSFKGHYMNIIGIAFIVKTLKNLATVKKDM